MGRAVVVFLLAAVMGCVAAGTAAGLPRYSGWVSDPYVRGYPPQRVLRVRRAINRAPVVFLFVDRSARGTRWKVCVNRADGRPACATGLTGQPGRASGRVLFPMLRGSYTASWTVSGKLVASWSFRVVS